MNTQDERSRDKRPRWPAPTTEQPSLETIEEWMWEDGGCEATDGCIVELDVAPWYGIVN